MTLLVQWMKPQRRLRCEIVPLVNLKKFIQFKWFTFYCLLYTFILLRSFTEHVDVVLSGGCAKIFQCLTPYFVKKFSLNMLMLF